MNTAIILAGGVGSRMGVDRPKQFLMVREKPIISYCFDIFQNHSEIDKIVVVVSEEWQGFVEEYAQKFGVTKLCGYAPAGKTRQHSIYNGLKCIEQNAPDTDIVIVHDAARPLVSDQIISDCIKGATEFDGAMPVISVKDTVYQSKDGKKIGQLLKRSELFAGQAPESFKFRKYLDIHNEVSDEEIASTAGSSEIAYRHGMEISMVKGSERNLKITTIEDLETFESILKGVN
ncbi:MAG: IspD/TarI family cytidylyltransferase [Ruminococcus sp.]|nr:IspD/TarI family cytidylyltransferase [Ruminococcus sp.]MEE1172696.1 IspD/TarI family cytidylyltransferase [Ruminococcus sp.]